jgi:hypothetical protein
LRHSSLLPRRALRRLVSVGRWASLLRTPAVPADALTTGSRVGPFPGVEVRNDRALSGVGCGCEYIRGVNLVSGTLAAPSSHRLPLVDQEKTLTALAMTSPTIANDMSDCSPIPALAHMASGITSVGPKVIEFVTLR